MKANLLLSRTLEVVGWLVVAPLLLAAAARIVAWDSRPIFIVANALTPLLYLPAWPVAVAAAVARRWPLAAAATVVVTTHVAFAAPELAHREDLPVEARSAPTFRVFSANVFEANRRIGTFSREIARARPDIVLLQESTPRFVAALDATGALAELPHREMVARGDPFAAFFASRWPLEDSQVVTVLGRPIAVGATIRFLGEPVRIYGVHAVSPLAVPRREEWIADLDHLATMAASETRPLILAGDFNATWGHKAFRRLLDRGGLTDAQAARGKPYRMTWSYDRSIFPTLVRIDHVLTKGRVVVTRIAVGEGLGSDHRPLVGDVALVGA